MHNPIQPSTTSSASIAPLLRLPKVLEVTGPRPIDCLPDDVGASVPAARSGSASALSRGVTRTSQQWTQSRQPIAGAAAASRRAQP